MKKKPFQYISILILIVPTVLFGQLEGYRYKSTISNPTNTWHSMVLPVTIFEDLLPDMSDIRIIKKDANGKLIQIPYILKLSNDEIVEESISYELLNQVTNNKGCFFTLKGAKVQSITSIQLDFENKNFDWKVNLEGSSDGTNWYSILKNQRITSIVNQEANYTYSALTFTPQSFKFYRVFVNSLKNVQLNYAYTSIGKTIKNTSTSFQTISAKISVQNKSADPKKTVLVYRVDIKRPTNEIEFFVKNNKDFLRNIEVDFSSDTTSLINAESYQYLFSGTISSRGSNVFKFDEQRIKQIKVTINNQDNQALDELEVRFKGPTYRLFAKFEGEKNLELYFGNSEAKMPQYDLAYFEDLIPLKTIGLSVGKKNIIVQKTAITKKAEPASKYWLWAVMLVIGGVIGIFSIKMLRGIN